MRTSIICNFVAASLLICGCREDAPKLVGSGVAKTETRDVAQFQRVKFQGEGRLELKAGVLAPLTITGDDNILPIITTSVEDGTLTIRPSQENIEHETELVIRATSPGIGEVHVMGSGQAVLQDATVEDVRLSIMGAGRMQATGKATDVNITIRGAGEIDTTALEAERVDVDISGAGSADVNAAKNLEVSIAGTGRVRYVGDPEVSKTIMGLGKVEKK